MPSASNIEALRFNVAVAQIYELTNALGAALQSQGSGRLAITAQSWRRHPRGRRVLVQMLGPMMPHLAEDCWARLGYHTLLADQPWPKAEAALLVDDTVTIAVQVNGKRRDEMIIARDAAKDEVEAAALEAGQRRCGRSKAARRRR